MVLNSLGIVTVLKPSLGYKQCAEIAREGYETGKSLHDIVVKETQAPDAGKVGRGLLVREPDQPEVRAMTYGRAGGRAGKSL
jgi:aspartate ammonia-lyase